MDYESTYFLVTLADLKEYLGIATSDLDYDIIMQNMLDEVYFIFKNATQRELKARELTEYYDGDGTTKLLLRSFPVNSTAATIDVRDDVDGIFGTDTKFDSDEIRIDSENGILHLVGATFSEGPQSVKVVYNAGYGYNGAKIPYDLQHATFEMCGFLWKRRQEKTWDVNSLAVAGSSIALVENEMPQTVKTVIARYRRPR